MSERPSTRVLLTLVGEDARVAPQAAFHRAAGLAVVVLPPGTSAAERAEQTRQSGADWVFHADPGEFLAPRGATVRELLDAVPARFGVVYGVRRGADGVQLRPVVRAPEGATARPLRAWYPFDVLAGAPKTGGPGRRRALDEEVALAIEAAELTGTGQVEARARLEAIESRLARLETGVVAKLRWKLTHRQRTPR